MSSFFYRSQSTAPYSNVERTSDIFANLLRSNGQYFKFRRRNLSVEFAFFHNVGDMGFPL